MKPDLKAIRERCEKATEGPWTDLFIGGPLNPKRVDVYSVGREGSHHILVKLEDEFVKSGFFKKGDASFIAKARADIPALLEYVERLEGLVEKIAHDPAYYSGLGTGEAKDILDGVKIAYED